MTKKRKKRRPLKDRFRPANQVHPSTYLGEIGSDLLKNIADSERLVADQTLRDLPRDWIQMRLRILGLYRNMQSHVFPRPVSFTEDQASVITLVTAFFAGVEHTAFLIYCGRYTRAAALLKLDIEKLARATEHRDSAVKPGKTPNVRGLPPGIRSAYGELNKVAHPANPEIYNALVGRIREGDEAIGNPGTPVVNARPLIVAAKQLFSLHVQVLFQFVLESLLIQAETFGDQDERYFKSMVAMIDREFNCAKKIGLFDSEAIREHKKKEV